MSTAATIAGQLAPALSSYAQRLHKDVRDDHHVVSPLGAWMLLALCARGSDGRLRDELTKALGMDVDLAATAVAELLEKPHAAVATGAGIWTSPKLNAESLAPWLAQLPVPVTRGEIPSKAALDQWADKRTRGMIREFPVQLSPLSLIVLATTFATDVRWSTPFHSAQSSKLDVGGPHDWSRQVQRVLQTPSESGHIQFIARTERAGDVCAHTVLAHEDLIVTSVIAERGVPEPDVIATAYEVAVRIACRRPVEKRSLFDLPLGDSPLWTISEEESFVRRAGAREETCNALLPAWSAQATHDLRRDELGFPAAAAWLAQLTGSSAVYDYDSNQAVVARYSRTGFEAAAVSFVAALGAAGSRREEPGLERHATLRFRHPFAVVAVTTESTGWDRGTPGRKNPSELWTGLPVYSAWVTVPTEAEEERYDDLFDIDHETLQKARPRSGVPSARALDWIKKL